MVRCISIQVEERKLVAVLEYLGALAPAIFGSQVVAVVVTFEPPARLNHDRAAVRRDRHSLVRTKRDGDVCAALRGAQGASL